jgi:hypothetical protein
MADLLFKMDTSAFESVLDEFKKDLQQELDQAVGNLSEMVLNKTLELAQGGLHTTFHIYKENLSSRKEGTGVYVISLDQKALWLEEGLEENFDMKPGLLKDAKTSKEGHKYAVVPFKHDTRPSQTTPKAQDLIDQVKRVLKQENIPFKKIETHPNGSPRLGLLHKIDIDSAKPTAKASTPALQGLRIYQKQDTKGKVSRGIFTFRTVTDGPKSADKWMHPGFDAKKFMDTAFDWGVETFEREIMPELLKKWG